MVSETVKMQAGAYKVYQGIIQMFRDMGYGEMIDKKTDSLLKEQRADTELQGI